MLELKSLPTGCSVRRRQNACSDCGARAFSVCGSLDEAGLDRLDAIAEHLTLGAGQSLIREGDDARHVFNVTSGSVRVYNLLPDGRRQIIGFLFAGDFLGLTSGETHVFSAEAIEPATVCRFVRSEYRALIRDIPALEAALLDRAGHELAAAQNQMLLLGRKTAMERIASFLLALPDLDPARRGPNGEVRLPMTRSEIADYLGLTIETVSRTLTQFQQNSAIELPSSRRMILRDREALASLNA